MGRLSERNIFVVKLHDILITSTIFIIWLVIDVFLKCCVRYIRPKKYYVWLIVSEAWFFTATARIALSVQWLDCVWAVEETRFNSRREQFIYFSKHSYLLWGPPSLHSGAAIAVSTGVKRPGREALYSPIQCWGYEWDDCYHHYPMCVHVVGVDSFYLPSGSCHGSGG